MPATLSLLWERRTTLTRRVSASACTPLRQFMLVFIPNIVSSRADCGRRGFLLFLTLYLFVAIGVETSNAQIAVSVLCRIYSVKITGFSEARCRHNRGACVRVGEPLKWSDRYNYDMKIGFTLSVCATEICYPRIFSPPMQYSPTGVNWFMVSNAILHENNTDFSPHVVSACIQTTCFARVIGAKQNRM